MTEMDLHGLRRRLSERFATMRRLGPLFSVMYAISRFLRLASAGRIKLCGASWDFDVFVEPSTRFGFTFARLGDEANQILSSQGVKWSISRISAFNPESLAAHKRMGSLRIASAGFHSLGSAQIMIAITRPYLDVSLRKGARPVTALRAPASAVSQPMTTDHPVLGHSNKQPERS